jgi:hypothetical protein
MLLALLTMVKTLELTLAERQGQKKSFMTVSPGDSDEIENFTLKTLFL